jgi:hypothetical protein
VCVCVSTAQHSNKLLLVSPAQPFLVSGPVETHDQIFVRSKTIYVFGNGFSSSTSSSVVSLHFLCFGMCSPPIVARKRLGQHVPAVTNTNATTQELLARHFYVLCKLLHCCITMVTRLFTLRLQEFFGMTYVKLFCNSACFDMTPET